MKFLHEVLKKHVVLEDQVLAFEANMRGSGWAHLSGEFAIRSIQASFSALCF